MIHNKYYEILRNFLGDYKLEIFGRQLIGKVSISQKGIALALEELEEKSVLKSRNQGTLKLYSLNLQNTEMRSIIMIIELLKKMEFMSRHRKLAYLFREDGRIVGIFGSYASGTEKPDSDVDLFIIGKKGYKDYSSAGKSLNLAVSIKYFSKEEWRRLLKEKNPLCNEIINKHVLVFGTEQFINYAWSDFFGVN